MLIQKSDAGAVIPSVEKGFWNSHFSAPGTGAAKNLGFEACRDGIAHHGRAVANALEEHPILGHAETAVARLRRCITRTIRIDKDFDIGGRCARSRQRHAVDADIDHAISMNKPRGWLRIVGKEINYRSI